MSDGAQLHSPGAGATPAEIPPPTILDTAAARSASREQNRQKATAASAHKRRKPSTGRPRGRPRKHPTAPQPAHAASPAPAASIPAGAGVPDLPPVTSADDLAKLIATAHASLSAVAPLGGQKGVVLVSALAWADEKGRPTAQCKMAAGLMWPWLRKTDAFGKLAAQADGAMFAAGVLVLLQPMLLFLVQIFARPQTVQLRVVDNPPPQPPPPPEPAAPASM